MRAHDIFLKNDAGATRSYYDRLDAIGLQGELAVALMRVLKRSKQPEGVGYRTLPVGQRTRRRRAEQFDRGEAYEWAIKELQRILLTHFETLGGSG